MIHKSDIILEADQNRVILQPMFYPGSDRVERIVTRVVGMNEEQVDKMLDEARRKFSHRHKHFERILAEHFDLVAPGSKAASKLSKKQRLLTGALLSMEYTFQAAALFNPSMTHHPDQSGLNEGQIRFVMSLRATGEGHLSSIVFRSGILNDDGSIELNPLTPYQVLGKYTPLHDRDEEYDLEFDEDSVLEERVVFPNTDIESRGMEDLRLVWFNDGDGGRYLGTYTAWNGMKIQSRILETNDFRTFRIRSLKGKSASDKGMAIFPERINGNYAIISRQGGENISIMFSDDLYQWDEHELLMEPEYPFEMAQLGNCGAPVKTDEGWLLLTHGVGAVREYTISAVLLDLDDPRKVRARLKEPLIKAEGKDREGYVPNVVYSCGGMLHGDKFFIPYAMSDSRCGFAWTDTKHLLKELLK